MIGRQLAVSYNPLGSAAGIQCAHGKGGWLNAFLVAVFNLCLSALVVCFMNYISLQDLV